MIGQSFAIIILILVMCFMFLRAGKRTGFLFALPLLSVSLFHLLGYAVNHLLGNSTSAAFWLHIAADILGLALGLLCCLILSRAITLKKLKITYFISCALFLSALAFLYINHHL